MIFEILSLSFLILFLFLINFILVKSNLLIHSNSNEEHKKFGLDQIPLSGGLFFFIVLTISPLIGIVIMKEEFNAAFIARAIFTATLSTVLYFMVNRRMQRRN